MLAPGRNSFVKPIQLSPRIKTINQNHATCWHGPVERAGLKAGAVEVELCAAAQAVMLVGSTSAALHSQSIWCCHQKWDPKGAIQGTFPWEGVTREISSVCRCGGVQCMSVEWKNGRREVLESESGYLKQSCDGIG